MSGELLLELLSEEIPARMQRRAIDDLAVLVRDKLAAAEIPAATLRGYVTPRRLTIIADGIPARQPDRSEERRGPRVGAPQQALDGFLRATGFSSIDQCEIRDTGRGEFFFAVLQRPGRASAEVLPELLHAAIAELPWPKSMRFPAAALRWVRPLTSVVCLFDGAVLPLLLDRVPVGRVTRGHRFLSDGEIAVENAGDYLEKLAAAHVILDHERRRKMIETDLQEKAAAAGLGVKDDVGLLDEVTGLVEYPVVLLGAIDHSSMELPPEVLATAMRTHQKYFSCLKADGTPAPRFLFVANNLTPDDGETIIAGNERVLRARLADARFFWDQDRKVRLEDRVEALKQRVYYDKLGTMYDKTERIELIAGFLAEQLSPAAAAPTLSSPASGGGLGRGNDDGELPRLAQRAAHLAKADLSTGMVGEFPELQGAMGRYYALNGGEDPRIADAIAEHYKPLGPGDTCPTAPVSIIVALADKIDALTAFFAVGEKPTGSRDPFALRRAALGVIRIILENRLTLRLGLVLSTAIHDPSAAISVLEFITERLKIHLRESGVRHDLIAAAFVTTEDDLLRLVARVDTLKAFIDSDAGSNLLIAYRRAASIVSIETRRDGRSYQGLHHGNEDSKLFVEAEEKRLARALRDAAASSRDAVNRGQFADAMTSLATLRRPVDEFFEKVTVNAQKPELRENRLRLLSSIFLVMNQVADFSQIEG